MDIKKIATSISNAAKKAAKPFAALKCNRKPQAGQPVMEEPVTTAKTITLYLQIWLYQVIGLLIFGIGRFAFLEKHTTHSERMENLESLPKFIYNSLRFDMQAVTYIALPMIIAALVVSFLKSGKATRRLMKSMQYYFAILLTIITLLVIAEFYYYDNFESRYNIVFFDFFDEGPLGLIQTMWEDYPVLSIMLFSMGTGIAIYFIGSIISRVRTRNRKWMGKTSTTAITILIPVITFIFMRGSVTLFPLQVEAFEATPNENINRAVPNALYLLKKSYKERINSFKPKSDESVLSEGGFDTIEEAIAASQLRQNNETDTTIVERALFNTMTREGNKPFEKPNVLLVMNESWSAFLLEMDDEEKLNLLCSLRPHLQEDLLMKNIQSVQNGTIYSIESTILAMPYPHYFQSRYRFDSLKASIAYPFYESGYNTRFVSGADLTWENLNEALKVQYFERIDGRQQILHTIPGSTANQIGAHDEFLYKYILKEMLEAYKAGKPQFFMALTTTNHPPFEYPDDMQLPPLTNEWYSSKYIKGESSVRTKYGLGAQYTNNCLGDFMTEFKQSELAENTIVIAIGDHNVRSILNYNRVPAEFKHSVPMYIYLPPKYALTADEKERISQRHGCHYDILPTIAQYAFDDGVKYLNIGQNLFDMEKDDSSFFSYNVNKVLTADMEREKEFKKLIKARITLIELYYQNIFRNSSN